MASLVETFHMPLREIEKKFTRSELVLIAWRSRESATHMKRALHRPTPSVSVSEPDRPQVAVDEKFFNEEGELDLRNVTGQEALDYLRKAEQQAQAQEQAETL